MTTLKISRVATGFLASTLILAVPALTVAQTTPPPKKPAVATPAKPAQAKAATTPAATTAKPVAASQTTAAKPVAASQTTMAKPVAASQTAARPVAATQTNTAVPATTSTGQTMYQPNGVATQNVYPATSSAGSVTSVPNNQQRGAVGLAGVGSFLWADWTAVVYGCWRTGTRVLCDFDTSKTNPQQANANQLWGNLNLVDDGGRVSQRHNEFFMGDDGSQFQTGYISQTPVRTLMEYDDVSPNINHATLVLANQRVQNVPISNVDPSQPAGSIPARGAGQAPAAAGAPSSSAPGASGNPLDQAQNGVNNAQNTVNNATGQVNDQKQKAKSLWQSLKGATQSTTSH